jgi:hypothetical protein
MEYLRHLLRGRRQVSVPQLQQELSVSYGQSRALVTELVRWGWLEEQPVGIAYMVREENMEPRLLSRAEMESIYPKMSSDMVRALGQILNRPGADAEFVEKGVHGMGDTEEALESLLDAEIIQQYGRGYYLRITTAAAELLLRILEDRPTLPFAARNREQMASWEQSVKEMLDRAYQNAQMI